LVAINDESQGLFAQEPSAEKRWRLGFGRFGETLVSTLRS
jgi:hypothetical protein